MSFHKDTPDILQPQVLGLILSLDEKLMRLSLRRVSSEPEPCSYNNLFLSHCCFSSKGYEFISVHSCCHQSYKEQIPVLNSSTCCRYYCHCYLCYQNSLKLTSYLPLLHLLLEVSVVLAAGLHFLPCLWENLSKGLILLLQLAVTIYWHLLNIPLAFKVFESRNRRLLLFKKKKKKIFFPLLFSLIPGLNFHVWP